MKYKVLIDYGSEGFRFLTSLESNKAIEFKSADEAVKGFLNSYAAQSPFLIVNVVEWEVIDKNL